MNNWHDSTPALSRRSLWKWTGAAVVAASVVAGDAAAAASSGPGVRVRWLGANAWEFTSDTATVLIDPWVSRFPAGTYKAGADPDTEIKVYPEAIDAVIGEADTILVTHGHWDHIADVPYIAGKTGATVIGTETHLNLLRAMDTPSEQLGQVVGGEHYRFGDHTVEIFPSSHATHGDHRHIRFGGTRPGAVPPKPTKIKHLVEGGSLDYLIDFDGVSFFSTGSANFHERAIAGIRPTVLFVHPGGGHTPDYVERLLAATGYPPYVVPTHWDDFNAPLTEPAVAGADWKELRDRVAKASPDSEFILIDHLESHVFSQ